GLPVPGRAALDGVGDEHLAAGKPDGPDDRIEELSRPAYKGASGLVLALARPLANEHDASGGSALARHGIGSAFAEETLAALSDSGADLIQIMRVGLHF